MAFTATCAWNVQTNGSDTANGGGFDRGVSGMATDGAATLATTSAPLFSSASYNFVAGDVGAWLYLKSGTAILPGWYKIVSVSSGVATLDAGLGHATLANGDANASIGCAATGSPSSATWSVDYSRQAGAQVTYTDLVIDATSNTKATSAAHPFTAAQVGNVVVITGGTGFTTQRVAIVSVSAGVATCDKALGTLSSTGGTGAMGGALANLGQAGALHVGGNKIFQKAGTYSITTITANVTGGTLSLSNGQAGNPTTLIGYNSVPGDLGTKPLNQITAASGTGCTLFALTGTFTAVFNVALDGLSRANTQGLSFLGGRVYWCKFVNFVGGAATMGGGGSGELCFCEASGCSTTVAFNASAGGLFFGNYAHNNTVSGFNVGAGVVFAYNISANNTGSGSWGFAAGNLGNYHGAHNLAYKNGAGGFDLDLNTSGGNNGSTLVNCLAWGNGGYNYRCNATQDDLLLLLNCAGGGAGTADYPGNAARVLGFLALTTNPTVDGDNGNFALNLNVGGGLLCRSGGILGVFAGGLTQGYGDVGAVQSQATNIVTLAIVKTYNLAGQPILTWTADSLATAYKVLRSVNGTDYTAIAVLSASLLTYTDAAEPSGTVEYSVLAVH